MTELQRMINNSIIVAKIFTKTLENGTSREQKMNRDIRELNNRINKSELAQLTWLSG